MNCTVMKPALVLLFAICAASLLSSCAQAWGAAYHHAGGWGSYPNGHARYLNDRGEEIAPPPMKQTTMDK